jgi:hypothetical protein
LNRTTGVLDRWQQQGDVKPVQQFSSRDGANGLRTAYDRTRQSDKGYVDASFIRLKNASLSFSLPEKLLSSTGIDMAKIFVQGQNLYTLTKYKGFDPETQRITMLPPLRTVIFGIQLTL